MLSFSLIFFSTTFLTKPHRLQNIHFFQQEGEHVRHTLTLDNLTRASTGSYSVVCFNKNVTSAEVFTYTLDSEWAAGCFFTANKEALFQSAFTRRSSAQKQHPCCCNCSSQYSFRRVVSVDCLKFHYKTHLLNRRSSAGFVRMRGPFSVMISYS